MEIDVSEMEIKFLLNVVNRLERCRHFIGDGVSIGNACWRFREEIKGWLSESERAKSLGLNTMSARGPRPSTSLKDQLLELILKQEET